MTSVKVKFTPSSVILKEGSVHYQIVKYGISAPVTNCFQVSGFLLPVKSMSRQEVEKAEKAILPH